MGTRKTACSTADTQPHEIPLGSTGSFASIWKTSDPIPWHYLSSYLQLQFFVSCRARQCVSHRAGGSGPRLKPSRLMSPREAQAGPISSDPGGTAEIYVFKYTLCPYFTASPSIFMFWGFSCVSLLFEGYTGCLVFHPYCKPVKRLQPCCCRHGEQWGAWTDAIITSDTEGLPPPSTLLTGGRVCLPLRQYGGHCQILLGYNSFFFFSLLSSMACKNAFKRLNMILHSPNWLHFSIFSICNKSLLFSLCLQRRWN